MRENRDRHYPVFTWESYTGCSLRKRWFRERGTRSVVPGTSFTVDDWSARLMTHRSWADLVCFILECRDVVLTINDRCLARRAAMEDDDDDVGRWWLEFEWRTRLNTVDDDVDGTSFDVTAGAMCRWRDFFRISCRRKKQSVQILIGSVGHLLEFTALRLWPGIEQRRGSPSSFSKSLNMSVIVGVAGDLKADAKGRWKTRQNRKTVSHVRQTAIKHRSHYSHVHPAIYGFSLDELVKSV